MYLRLSRDDERAKESVSIENQEKMLTDYVSQQAGWNLVEVYENDGYSGTNFDHLGVQKILDNQSREKSI